MARGLDDGFVAKAAECLTKRRQASRQISQVAPKAAASPHSGHSAQKLKEGKTDKILHWVYAAVGREVADYFCPRQWSKDLPLNK